MCEKSKDYYEQHQVLEIKSEKLQPKGNTGIEEPVQFVQLLIKKMFPFLNKKLKILKDKENNLLNKASKCRHQNKYILRTVASKIQNTNVTWK